MPVGKTRVEIELDFGSFDKEKRKKYEEDYLKNLPYRNLKIREDCWSGGVKINGEIIPEDYTAEDDAAETKILRSMLEYAEGGRILYTPDTGFQWGSVMVKSPAHGNMIWVDKNGGMVMLTP